MSRFTLGIVIIGVSALGSSIAGVLAIPPLGPRSARICAAALAQQSTDARVSIRGRCLDAVSKAPIANVQIRLSRTIASNVPGQSRSPDSTWKTIEQTRTDAQGQFAFSLQALEEFTYVLRFEAAGYSSGRTVARRVCAGEAQQVPDIALDRRGGMVSGIVRDREGEPVADAKLSIRYAGFKPGPELITAPKQEIHHTASTDRRGHFAVKHDLSAGTWRISISGREMLSESSFNIPCQDGRVVLSLRVSSLPLNKDILGFVVDAKGHPVAGAEVSLLDSNSADSRTVSGADGRFRLRATRELLATGPWLKAAKQGMPDGSGVATTSWGDTQVRIVLKPRAPIEIRVVDGATGQAVDAFGIDCFEWNRDAAQFVRAFDQPGLAYLGKHTNGQLAIAGLSHEAHWIRVRPTDPRYPASQWIRYSRTGRNRGEFGRPIIVHASAKQVIRLTSPTGEPIVGTKVDLLWSPARTEVWPRSRTSTPEQLHRKPLTEVIELATGTTDARGEVQLAIDPNQSFTVRAVGKGHGSLVSRNMHPRSSAGPLVFELSFGATVEGTLKLLSSVAPNAAEVEGREAPASRSLQPIGVHLSAVKSRTIGVAARDPYVPLQADGSFTLDGIPEGDWDLKLRYLLGGGTKETQTAELIVAVLKNLKPTELRRIELNAAPLLLGTLVGNVKINGSTATLPYAFAHGFLTAPDGTHRPITRWSIPINAQGQFTTDFLPGHYRLGVEAFIGGKRHIIHCPKTFTIKPGQKLRRSFDLQLTSLNLRVLSSNGMPPLTPITLAIGPLHPHARIRSITTDWDGFAHIENLPLGTCEILCLPSPLQEQAALNQHMISKGLSYIDSYISIQEIDLTNDLENRTITLPPTTGY